MVCETCEHLSLQVGELKEIILQLADRFDRQEAYIQKIASRIDDIVISPQKHGQSAEPNGNVTLSDSGSSSAHRLTTNVAPLASLSISNSLAAQKRKQHNPQRHSEIAVGSKRPPNAFPDNYVKVNGVGPTKKMTPSIDPEAMPVLTFSTPPLLMENNKQHAQKVAADDDGPLLKLEFKDDYEDSSDGGVEPKDEDVEAEYSGDMPNDLEQDGPVLNSSMSDIVATHQNLAAYLATAGQDNLVHGSSETQGASIFPYFVPMLNTVPAAAGSPAVVPLTFASVEAMASQIETITATDSSQLQRGISPLSDSFASASELNGLNLSDCDASMSMNDFLARATSGGTPPKHHRKMAFSSAAGIGDPLSPASGLGSTGFKTHKKQARGSAAVSDRNEKGNFVCELCSAKFLWRGTWKRHVMTVHSKIRYKCTQCGFTSSRKDYLYVHIRSNACAKRKEWSKPGAASAAGAAAVSLGPSASVPVAGCSAESLLGADWDSFNTEAI